MLDDFNILATTSRGNEGDACSELRYLLEEMGDSAANVDKTGVSGLVAVKTTLDPLWVIERLREILHERPYEFRYTLRIIPIEKVVCTDLGEIQRAATELSCKISESETFRVTVEKRFTQMSSREVIEATAVNVKRNVNLDNPDKILLVEIIGGLTGISVIKPSYILSIIKEKML